MHEGMPSEELDLENPLKKEYEIEYKPYKFLNK